MKGDRVALRTIWQPDMCFLHSAERTEARALREDGFGPKPEPDFALKELTWGDFP